jgi:predicted ATP-grasp superfamily ATP-dependent carboligase
VDDIVKLWEKPRAEEKYMIAGWHQWADAGAISSGLPQYLIKKTKAHKIGEITPDPFYLFQIPGTHHLLRPEIKLEEGFRESLTGQSNEFFYTGDARKGLVFFMGEEPHMNADRYADALLDVAEALEVKRIAAVGGVYGAMPYDKAREVSCVYSLRPMKEELSKYAVRFSNYEGGTTIGTYLVDRAERRDMELFVFYAFVPAYDFSQLSTLVQGIRIENDFKAWYDLMRRFNHMFDLNIDLSELEQQSEELLLSMEAEIDELDDQMPQLQIRDYMEEVAREFQEKRFVPLDDVWEKGLQDIFRDMDMEDW